MELLLLRLRIKIIKLDGYGRETKRPVIGYGQRPENGQRVLNRKRKRIKILMSF